MAKFLVKFQRYFRRRPVRFFTLLALYLAAGSLVFLHAGFTGEPRVAGSPRGPAAGEGQELPYLGVMQLSRGFPAAAGGRRRGPWFKSTAKEPAERSKAGDYGAARSRVLKGRSGREKDEDRGRLSVAGSTERRQEWSGDYRRGAHVPPGSPLPCWRWRPALSPTGGAAGAAERESAGGCDARVWDALVLHVSPLSCCPRCPVCSSTFVFLAAHMGARQGCRECSGPGAFNGEEYSLQALSGAKMRQGGVPRGRHFHPGAPIPLCMEGPWEPVSVTRVAALPR